MGTTTSSVEKKRFYGWTIVASCFVVIFLHLSIRGSFSSFLGPMCQDMGWSTATTSGALSLFMVFYGLTAYFAGDMSTKYGPKKVTMIHGIIFGIGLFLSGYAQEPWQFYVTYGVMGGIGAGALFAPPTALVRRWFIKDLAKALGFATAGAGLGFFIAPNISLILIEQLSWRQAMHIFGVIVTIGCVIASLFMKGSPEEIGLKPLGYEELMAKAKGKSEDIDFSVSLKDALKTSAFACLALMWFFSNFGEYIVFSHCIKYVVGDKGFDSTLATRIYSIIGLVFFILGFIVGKQIDKYGEKLGDPFKARKNILGGLYILAVIDAIILQFIPYQGTAVYIIYAVLFGATMGTYVPTVAGYVGCTFGRNDMGRIWGLITLIGMAGGGGLGPYIGGWLRDLSGNYSIAIWVATVCYALAFIFCLGVKKPSPSTVSNR